MKRFDGRSTQHGDALDSTATRWVGALVAVAILSGGCALGHSARPRSINAYSSLLVELPFPATSDLLWSTDGHTLLVSTGDVMHNKDSQVDAIDVATAEVHTIVSEPEYRVSRITSWAPDGRHFMFVASSGFNPDSKQGLWVADVNRAESTTLLVEANAGAWSPVSRELAIYRGDAKQHGVAISLYDPQTREEKLLFAGSGLDIEHLSWSPDGKRLAFRLASSATNGDVVILDVATGTVTPLTTDGLALGLSWSPGSDMIAYSAWHDSPSRLPAEVHIAKVDGSCDVTVPDSMDVLSPAWSPDGKYLAYSDGPRIYLYDLTAAFGPDFPTLGRACP